MVIPRQSVSHRIWQYPISHLRTQVKDKQQQTRKKILKAISKGGEPPTQDEFNRILNLVSDGTANGLAEAIGRAQEVNIITLEPRHQSSLQTTKDLTDSEKIELAEPSGQLPLLYSNYSASPNPFIRGSLFPCVRNSSRREYVADWTPLITWEKECSLSIKGERFAQIEHNIFLVLLKLFSDQGKKFDEPLIISTYAILKEMNIRSIKTHYYEMVRLSLERLVSTTLQIKVYWVTYTGSILYSARLDEKHGNRWKIKLNPDLISLFQDNQYTYLPLGVHLKLKSNLSQWLHCFIRSQSYKTIKMSVKKLYALSGSRVKHLSTFRQQLKKALLELWQQGVIRTGWIVDVKMVEFRPAKRTRKLK
jgi:hypothetical protein